MSNGDPVGSEAPRGKSCGKRMGRYDGSFTPTEQRVKDELMRQFMRNPEGEPPSAAYVNAPCWCACGRLKSVGDLCARCAAVEAMEHQADYARWRHNPSKPQLGVGMLLEQDLGYYANEREHCPHCQDLQ